MNDMLEFYCIDCGSPINLIEKDMVKCLTCDRTLADENNLYDLRKFGIDYYFDDIPRDQIQEVLNLQINSGWRQAVNYVRGKYGKDRPYLANLLVDSRRANWVYLVNPKNLEYALEIGCGWGGSIPVLSRQFDHVFAVDLTRERVAFARQRCLEMGLENVTFGIGFDSLDFPFGQASFDLIAMNGVLAYIPELTDGNPRDLQLEFLTEIYKIMRPGGNLYIGSQNRFGLAYLKGNVDHAGLKWTSVMPRWMATLYRKTLGLNGYRNYTYTAAGYGALLKEAGFEDIQFFWPHHNHAAPRLISELNDQGIQLGVDSLPPSPDGRRLKYQLIKMANYIGVLKYFVPSYSIVCRRSVG